jgi:hypothetical protein
MAKQAAVRTRSTASQTEIRDDAEFVPNKKSPRPSSLLDTRVVYCGDNLEQLAKLPDATPRRMQKEEGRIMKTARSSILHSTFRLLHLPHYHCDWHASYYVKVMLN